jgi:hypothetical protein
MEREDRLSYKILITIKIFGIAIWKSYYCEQTDWACLDVSWCKKEDAIEKIRQLEFKDSYKKVEDA